MIITAKLKDGIRFLCLSIVSLSGWAGMLNPVQAQSVSQCTFSRITPGIIVKSSTGLKALEASNGLLEGSNGSTGSVALNCTGPGTLVSIGLPTLNFAPTGFIPTIKHALVQDISNITATGNMFVSNGGGSFTHAPWAGRSTARLSIIKGNHTLSIGMIVGENIIGSPPSGLYSYSTVLTVVPK